MFAAAWPRKKQPGIRLAQDDSFSLILLDGDVVEAGLNTAITKLRTDPALKDIPLVVFITDDHSGMNQTLLNQGCAAVLTKPLDLAIMYGVLARLTGQPRSTARVDVKMSVDVSETKGNSYKILTSVNISEGGLFLRTVEPLPGGTRLHIKFTLPHDTDTIELAAEVVRTLALGIQFEREPGMALRFVDISKNTLLKIRNFIQWEVTGDLEWKSNF